MAIEVDAKEVEEGVDVIWVVLAVGEEASEQHRALRPILGILVCVCVSE